MKKIFLSTLLLTFTFFSLASSVNAAGFGLGPNSLSNSIDDNIDNFRQDEGVVGLTVAVTKNGRLLYSKGFGYSKSPEYNDGINIMQRTHRTRIGSVSKAIVSGPATYQAMQENGFDPEFKKVYGADGIFGEYFSPYQRVSIDRFQPIIAMAIAPNDEIYTWYDNGTVSVGNSTNLTANQSPRSFEVAEGKTLQDLHAIAINPDSHVYAWYKDGTFSIGNSRDLDARRPIMLDGDGDPTEYVSMPVGSDGDRKSMHDVVGIGIAKSNSHVYTWYLDGTMSSGTSLNFNHYFSNETYSSPVVNGQEWRYQIRGMGIAANDRIYSWASTGKAFAGHSRDLDATYSPYNYSHAFDQHNRNRYRDITVQHLFDHTSGFFRSGDVKAAARMFPYYVENGELDYDLIHKHFLTTRPLKSDPGTRYSYSNHGMGLMTLIIPELTGKSYREYTVNHYLKPMGMKKRVRPQKVNSDTHDSFAYERSGNSVNQLDFKDSTVGLAAGGWTASAQGILAVTAKLQDRYSYDEINSFGFRSKTSGKLYHNGATGGGYAQLSLFPDDYNSASGEDLSGIHVAIALNTGNLSDGVNGRINALIGDIAIATAQSNLSNNVDYWPQAW